MGAKGPGNDGVLGEEELGGGFTPREEGPRIIAPGEKCAQGGKTQGADGGGHNAEEVLPLKGVRGNKKIVVASTIQAWFYNLAMAGKMNRPTRIPTGLSHDDSWIRTSPGD